MKKLIIFIQLCLFSWVSAQDYWSPMSSTQKNAQVEKYYRLDIDALRKKMATAETSKSKIIIDVPTLQGKVEKFEVHSFPVMDKALAGKYELGSYTGVSVENPNKTIRFSLSPNQFQSMIRWNGNYEFIEPAQGNLYKLHPKTNKIQNGKPFECSTTEPVAEKTMLGKMFEEGKKKTNNPLFTLNTSDRKYRTLRLALSVTGEYTSYFGGIPFAMAQINATLTRVNGIFENDFALHLNMINQPELIYDNAATDPYSVAGAGGNSAWAMELQKTLTSVVGEDNYDIGHLFGASGGGGNAGCIGCICVSPELDANGVAISLGKGSAYTSPVGAPMGDVFDIDFVAHELGHQLGANHTFSYRLEYTGAQVEPGSGSTIMGYAGITGVDVQSNSDPYFSGTSIHQVIRNLTSKTCDLEHDIANTPPVIQELKTWHIPKGTAYILTAEASDAENDRLTYSWEQNDNAQYYTVTQITGEEVYGPMNRALYPTTEKSRYIPKLSSVLAGKLTVPEDWESVPLFSRNLNFRVVVRDNNPLVGQAQLSYADQSIIVGDVGPFKIDKQPFYYSNLPVLLKWDVAQTNESPYDVANVKVDFTADSGASWHTILPSTENDGEETITIPEEFLQKNIQIRISAIDHIFYAVSEPTIVIAAEDCSGNPVENLTVDIKNETAFINWKTYNNATYVIRYKQKTASDWVEVSSENPHYELANVADETLYEVQVAQMCSGVLGEFSASVDFMLPAKAYCTLSAGNATMEYISNVTVNAMVNESEGAGYSDFTKDSDKIIYLKKGSTDNRISVTIAYPGEEDYYETLSAWIDFNRDGLMSEEERIIKDFIPDPSNGNVQRVTKTYTFTVPENAFSGEQSLRMRVALKVGPSLNSVPASSCYGTNLGTIDEKNTFLYGEVEDYKVIIRE